MARHSAVFLLMLCGNLFFAQSSVSISVDTIVKGKMSVRALMVDGNKIWYAANGGRYGFYDSKENLSYEKYIVFNTIKPEFRSIAQTSKAIFILGIGSPALLYKIDKQTLKTKLVYRETNKKAFYDSMQFFDDKDGIAVGDPIGKTLSILTTRDSGETWNRIDDFLLPEISDGEAVFAASNSNIKISGNNVRIVTGGKKARVLFSSDRGKTWKIFDTPILQGNAMTGIFTCDFHDDKIGIIAGGDYENQQQNFSNKAVTENGGKTWKLIADNQGFGYASCIQFFPDEIKRRLLCVGTSGIWYSPDFGSTWQKLSDDKTLYTIRFKDFETVFAAGKDKIVRIKLK